MTNKQLVPFEEFIRAMQLSDINHPGAYEGESGCALKIDRYSDDFINRFISEFNIELDKLNIELLDDDSDDRVTPIYSREAMKSAGICNGMMSEGFLYIAHTEDSVGANAWEDGQTDDFRNNLDVIKANANEILLQLGYPGSIEFEDYGDEINLFYKFK